MPGFYDDNAQFVPYKQRGADYELESHDRQAIDDIKARIKRGSFGGRNEVLESIQFLESLNKRIAEIIRNEESHGNDNWTLKVVHEEIVELFSLLKQEYKKF